MNDLITILLYHARLALIGKATGMGGCDFKENLVFAPSVSASNWIIRDISLWGASLYEAS